MTLVSSIFDALEDRESWIMSELAVRRIADAVPRERQDPTPDPRRLAGAIGYETVVAPIDVCGGVAVVHRTILFRWHLTQAVWGLRIYHGLAHALLARTTCRYSEADALRVTLELVAPTRYACTDGGDLLELAQSFAPAELVREAVRSIRLRQTLRASSHIRMKKVGRSEFFKT